VQPNWPAIAEFLTSSSPKKIEKGCGSFRTNMCPWNSEVMLEIIESTEKYRLGLSYKSIGKVSNPGTTHQIAIFALTKLSLHSK
jgi:hypothetical protein